MKILVLILALPALLACTSNDPDEKEWIQLFNGKDLEGWDLKIKGYDLNDNFNNTFLAEGGILKVSYDQYTDFDGQFGHIFHKQKFSYYLLAAEYRFVGDQVPNGPDWAFRNNGLMLHSQSAQSMAKDQDFPISIEVQLLGGNGNDERPTANLCTPGTHVVMDGKLFEPHCINSSSKTYHGDQWVRVEVLVLGDSIMKHIVEGDTVLSYEKPQIGGGVVNDYNPNSKPDGALLGEGYIALQAESHPTEFRKVEVLPLIGCTDPKATNYKSYYLKSDNSQCRYD